MSGQCINLLASVYFVVLKSEYRLALCRNSFTIQSPLCFFLPRQGFKIDPMTSNTTHAYTSLGYSTLTKPGCLVFAVLGVCSHYSDSQLPITLLSGDTRQNESVRLSIFMHFYRVLMTFSCCHLPTGELL